GAVVLRDARRRVGPADHRNLDRHRIVVVGERAAGGGQIAQADIRIASARDRRRGVADGDRLVAQDALGRQVGTGGAVPAVVGLPLVGAFFRGRDAEWGVVSGEAIIDRGRFRNRRIIGPGQNPGDRPGRGGGAVAAGQRGGVREGRAPLRAAGGASAGGDRGCERVSVPDLEVVRLFVAIRESEVVLHGRRRRVVVGHRRDPQFVFSAGVVR